MNNKQLKKHGSAFIIVIIFALISVVCASAYAVYSLAKIYRNLQFDDFYALEKDVGELSEYFLGCTDTTLNVLGNREYAFDIVVRGATISGKVATKTSGDVNVYEFDAGTTSLSFVGSPFDVVIIKHSDRNLYVSSIDDLHSLSHYDAVFRNASFDNDGTRNPTESSTADDDIVYLNEISYNLKEVYLISNIATETETIVNLLVPMNFHPLWNSVNNVELQLHNGYEGVCRFYEGYRDSAYGNIKVKNYSGCSVDGFTVTDVSEDFSDIVLNDAKEYALAVLPESIYHKVVLPEKYLDVQISYGAFDGSNSREGLLSSELQEITVSVSNNGGTSLTGTKNVLFCAIPNDYLGSLLTEYTSDLSLFVKQCKSSGFTITMDLETNGAVNFTDEIVGVKQKVLTAVGSENTTLSETAILTSGSKIYYKLTAEKGLTVYEDAEWREMTVSVGLTANELFGRYLTDLYMTPGNDTAVSLGVLNSTATEGGGRLFNVSGSLVFYANVPAPAYSIWSATIVSENNIPIDSVAVPATAIVYENGNIVAPIGSSGAISSELKYFYQYSVILPGEDTPTEFWRRIYFQTGGHTGGSEISFASVILDVPNECVEPFSISADDATLYYDPQITKVNGNNVLPNPEFWDITKLSAVNNNGIYLTQDFSFKVNWDLLAANSAYSDNDVVLELSVRLYLSGEDGFVPLSDEAKTYYITIPCVYSASDFSAKDDFSDANTVSGLWLYLNILQKLFDIYPTSSEQAIIGSNLSTGTEATANYISNGGYVRKSALQSSLLNDLNMSAAAHATDNLSDALAYYNITSSTSLAYADLFVSEEVNTNILDTFNGISKLSSLRTLTTDNLNLSNCIITEIGDLTNLETLSMKGCKSSTLDVSNLIKLETAYLSSNSIINTNGLPASLIELDLSDIFSGVLELNGIGRLYRLTTLDISNANIADFAPLCELDNLETIKLFDNSAPTECIDWVIVHLFNHYRTNIQIYCYNDSVENVFTLSQNTPTGTAIWLNGYTMYQAYFDLYTQANGIIFVSEYGTLAEFKTELQTINDNINFGETFKITEYSAFADGGVIIKFGFVDNNIVGITSIKHIAININDVNQDVLNADPEV